MWILTATPISLHGMMLRQEENFTLAHDGGKSLNTEICIYSKQVRLMPYFLGSKTHFFTVTFLK